MSRLSWYQGDRLLGATDLTQAAASSGSGSPTLWTGRRHRSNTRLDALTNTYCDWASLSNIHLDCSMPASGIAPSGAV